MAKGKVLLKPKAREDLEDIWRFTRKLWGSEQADRYIGTFASQFDLLSKNPKIGRTCESIRRGYRRFEVEKHIIFYKFEKSTVIVVRILHQRMDVPDHLQPREGGG